MNQENGQLKRTLTLFPCIMIMVTSVIGGGIFTVPGEIMTIAKGSGPNIVAWVVAGIAVLLMGLVYCELAPALPGAGGPAVYLREAYGDKMSFFYGWFAMLNNSAVLAVVSITFTNYLTYFIPLTTFQCRLVSTALLLIAMFTNVRGVKMGATATNILTIIKLVVLGAIIVGGIFFLVPDNFQPIADAELGWSTAFPAAIPAFFAFSGYNQLTYMSEEIKDPEKTLPRAILLGIGVICLVYILLSVVCVGTLSVDVLAGSTNSVTMAAEIIFGKAGAAVVSIGALISIYGLINAGFMSMPRVAFNVGRAGLFPGFFGKVHPKFDTPYCSIMVYCGLALLLLWTGSFSTLLTMVVFVGKISEFLVATALVVLRKKRPDLNRPIKMPLYPFSIILSIALTVFLAARVPVDQIILSLIFCATSVPAYLIFFLFRKFGKRNQQ